MLINQKYKFDSIIRNASVLRRLIECQTFDGSAEEEWVLKTLKLIMLGVEDPLPFLWILYDKFEVVYQQELLKDSKLYKILNKEKA